MAFKSLSKTIRTQVQELDKQKGTNAPLRSTVRNYLNPVFVVNNNEEYEPDVIVWGSSTWGVEKVTAEYKPNQTK